MSEPLKTFKVPCPYADCLKPFHVRFPLTQSEATGTGEAVVMCPYCTKQVVITIPRVYIEEDALVRGLTSQAMEG
jgi:hypothetical protein